MQRASPAGGQRKFPSKPRGSRNPWQKPRPKRHGNWGHQSADGARHGGLAPESLGALETRKSSGGLLVVHASVREYGDPFRILIDSGAALVSNVPTSVRDWGARDGRQGAYAPEEVLGVTDSSEDVAMSLATGRENKAHCQACGITTTASPNAESRRAVWASTVAVPDGTDQAGDIGPQAAEAAEESAKGVSCVGNIGTQVGTIGPQAGNVVPQAGNIVPLTVEAVEEDAEGASGVGNIVPRKIEETEKIESAACVSSVGNIVPRGVKKTSAVEHPRVDNQVSHSESETPPARPVREQCHVFDDVSCREVKSGSAHLEALPEVSALLNLEELSMKDFLAELKAGEIAEMVLLKPETSPEDLNSSSVMDEDVLEGFTKQRATRLSSEILKNPEDPVYPLVKEYSDV
ncbi:Pol protein, partial [Phytophthora palmivora]